MRTFHIATLGCKVNQYESEQMATLLRSHGLVPAASAGEADLRIINTCSVTVQAASKSRQASRNASRDAARSTHSIQLPQLAWSQAATGTAGESEPSEARTIVTGCWATSDRDAAGRIPGIDAVITHHEDVAERLAQLVSQWRSLDHARDVSQEPNPPVLPTRTNTTHERAPEPLEDDGWMIQAGSLTPRFTASNKSHALDAVNKKTDGFYGIRSTSGGSAGAPSLPLLDGRQEAHQRAFLKVQDGCDAYCTYCIIPSLRPRLWSKRSRDAVDEAQRMVDAGHREIVLTGIFLGAYGHETALRRRQAATAASPLAELVEALCTKVNGLKRVRLSSLEPGDLTEGLIEALRSFKQVVPHFHLPLQSGSDAILRKMNRQYTRAEFLEMLDRVRGAFDRPALTTDVIVGFPGETDDEFERTLEVVDDARFIHVHAFHFSPRPGTAAARWTKQYVRGPVVQTRVRTLNQRSAAHDHAFRQQFIGETVEVLVERPGDQGTGIQHGRCERYFPVHFESAQDLTGTSARLRIERVTPGRTHGILIGAEEGGA